MAGRGVILKIPLGMILLLAALTLAAPALGQDEGWQVVDRVVVVVGAAGERGQDAEMVTSYELEVEAMLVLAERARSAEAARPEALTESFLDAVLENLIHHLLIVSEASRLELVTLSDEEIASERQEIGERLGEGGLERFIEVTGLTGEIIDSIVRRRALVAAFIQRNVNLSVRVTDADIEALYRQGEHPFGDRPLGELRESLEALITARRQRERLTGWLTDARRRSWVRVIPP